MVMGCEQSLLALSPHAPSLWKLGTIAHIRDLYEAWSTLAPFLCELAKEEPQYDEHLRIKKLSSKDAEKSYDCILPL